MSIAIGYQAVSQVRFTQEPIIIGREKHFNSEKRMEVKYDYGEEIVVI